MIFSTMDKNNLEHPYQSFIHTLIQNLFHYPLTLVKEIIGYAQQDISLNDYKTTKYRINELTEFMDAYTLNYLTQSTSETLKKLYCLNLSKQHEREYKSQNSPYPLMSQNSLKKIKNFSACLISNTQNNSNTI